MNDLIVFILECQTKSLRRMSSIRSFLSERSIVVRSLAPLFPGVSKTTCDGACRVRRREQNGRLFRTRFRLRVYRQATFHLDRQFAETLARPLGHPHPSLRLLR
jgi:hypothetical protein